VFCFLRSKNTHRIWEDFQKLLHCYIHCIFNFRVKQVNCLTLKLKTLWSFETPTAVRHIPDDLNALQHCCGATETSQNSSGDLTVLPTHHDEVLDLDDGLLLETSDSLDSPAILWPTWIGSGLSGCVLVAILARHRSCNDATLTAFHARVAVSTAGEGDKRPHAGHVTA
jgi:hypothetical protein